ncbi:hypothetical protein BDU57DRAFT_439618 [Ampelomyces quisqualis]|uniref:Uncharacterized protein n=1 Tax=Ampelomyces quisqualis TaxID=50730 RepID=A0A6A5R2V5_AMPQU|nr:hypothetical protein BDU57DRAFT_439618 [Ampelomyces quisqualis]
MKTDNYLNLCLEQAAKSPLRYRHGAVIVRGGKVIGQGYNDYRVGFDGGALKTGLLPLRSFDGPAMTELKKKRKNLGVKPNLGDESTKTFTPFEHTTGGGKLANTPLSMHSEMMAIQSALAAAGSVVSGAVSSQKPCFKLSGDDKRKARLRRDAIKLYVETICKYGDLNSLHLDRAALRLVFHSEEKNKNVASSLKNSAVKHRMKKEKKGHHNTCHNANNGQHKYSRSHCAHKSSASSMHNTVVDDTVCITTQPVRIASEKLSGSAHTPSPSTPQGQPILVPKGRTGQATRALRDRTKLPRLHGADIYVARLGWKLLTSNNESGTCCMIPHAEVEVEPPPRIATGSLHEELRNPQSRPRPDTTNMDKASEKHPSVLSSRPCYRCVTYMSSVGIKRVFWTAATGEWESAKVRDLVDAMDNLGLEQPMDVATTLNSVFVTKHEVLMLRRTMG